MVKFLWLFHSLYFTVWKRNQITMDMVRAYIMFSYQISYVLMSAVLKP